MPPVIDGGPGSFWVWDGRRPRPGRPRRERDPQDRQTEARLVRSLEAVYDPFLGSGTTLIAAERHARACYGMDVDPLYCP
ncbi:hypothetical protein BH23CHL8_BH23CHL8_31590 [soil metagenome]